MTQVETLLTFCPPWPPERTKDSSMSASRTPNAAMRCASWFSFSRLTGNAPMVLPMVMPPIRPDKERGGDEKNCQLDEGFPHLEHEDEQHDSDQQGGARGQIVGEKLVEEVFDFVQIHDGSSNPATATIRNCFQNCQRNQTTVSGPSKMVRLMTSVLAMCGPCFTPLGAWKSAPLV